ncbi:prepilin peptidase [Coriobacterium glomerans]|uniref:prepilin peptidase n=1 Tax=Coriobacterium glomerans TaxID=33871 RepID=UPI0012EAF28A|nr:prepilin peptidase [Coriobacterium glomerans]
MSAAPARVAAQVVLLVLLGIAARIDAMRCRLPNGLACALAAAGAANAFATGGVDMLLARLGGALVALCLLAAIELLWRSRRSEVGIGFGDIKAVFALVLAGPLSAFVAFVIGLVALAITGVALGRRALPFIPFLALSYLLVICTETALRLF